MSPRNYHAKFTPGSDPDFWWRFSPSSAHYNSSMSKDIRKKKSLANRFFSKFKRNHNKDFT